MQHAGIVEIARKFKSLVDQGGASKELLLTWFALDYLSRANPQQVMVHAFNFPPELAAQLLEALQQAGIVDKSKGSAKYKGVDFGS